MLNKGGELAFTFEEEVYFSSLPLTTNSFGFSVEDIRPRYVFGKYSEAGNEVAKNTDMSFFI